MLTTDNPATPSPVRVPGSEPGDLPIAERTVPRMLRRAVAAVPDQPAVIEPQGRTLTYREVGDAAQRVATVLRSSGLEPADRVLVMLDQHADTVLTWLGANIASVVFVPVNTAYRGETLRYVIEHSRARTLVIEGGWCDRLADLEPGFIHLQTVYVRGEQNAELPQTLERRAFEDLTSVDPIDVGEPMVSDISSILYTSGTEGRAKGVLMPQGHAYLSSFSYTREHHDAEVMMVTLPMFHGGGLHTSVLQPIRTAGTMVLHGTFSPSRFWQDVKQFGCTTSLIVGPMASLLMQQPPRSDDREHSLRTMVMFPVIPAIEEFSARFGVAVGVGYGQTEQGPSLWSRPGEGRPGLCGTPTSAFEARLVGADDCEVAPGEVGELVLRPRDPWSMMQGYFNDPEATAAAWRNLWYHTGDLLRIDGNTGQWAFVDRRKDVLRRRGENISSLEIERELLALAGVVEAAVVAVPSDEGEDEIKAVLVLDAAATFDHLSAVRELLRRMPHFMVPRFFETVAALPKTQSMRVQKAALRSTGLAGQIWDCEAAGFRVSRRGLVAIGTGELV